MTEPKAIPADDYVRLRTAIAERKLIFPHLPDSFLLAQLADAPDSVKTLRCALKAHEALYPSTPKTETEDTPHGL